jgi:hypothetical protein
MAYLRDPDHFVNGRDMLTEAGGRYLERREIMNIFSQNLRKLYPGIDVSAIKKEQDKYKTMRTCNYKGCNKAFSDGRSLMAHRKAEHPNADGKKHDHSHRQYTCPAKGCHRKKKSKGFPTLLALREHQVKMEHWGSGLFHGVDGTTPCDAINGPEDFEQPQETAGAEPDLPEDTNMHSSSHGLGEAIHIDPSTPQQASHHHPQASLSIPLSVPQHPLPNDHPLMPLITHGVVNALPPQSPTDFNDMEQDTTDPNLMPIDPAMHPPRQPQHHAGSQGGHMSSSMPQTPEDPHQRQAMFERYQQLQEELGRLRGVLFTP